MNEMSDLFCKVWDKDASNPLIIDIHFGVGHVFALVRIDKNKQYHQEVKVGC